jgi:hypothetical protein
MTLKVTGLTNTNKMNSATTELNRTRGAVTVDIPLSAGGLLFVVVTFKDIGSL